MKGPHIRNALVDGLGRSGFRNILIGLTCLVAFLVMASIFSPVRTQAGGSDDSMTYSSQTRDKLAPLGQIEGDDYIVRFYSTPTGPLYSVYNRDGRQLVELLPPDQVAELYPELAIPGAVADVGLATMGSDAASPR